MDDTLGETAKDSDQIAKPEVIIVPAAPAPIIIEPTPQPTPSPTPAAPPPPVLIKAAGPFQENCAPARKLEITENSIKLTTADFGLKLDPLTSDFVQCLVTMEATVAKGKRLVPVVSPQSYFAGLGMLASGQSLQIDYNILTLNGETIEASLEYEAFAAGPIGSDTEFVRSLSLIRRITPPCQLTDISRRVLVLQILLKLEKGPSSGQPFVTVRDLPRIDYVLENCNS